MSAGAAAVPAPSSPLATLRIGLFGGSFDPIHRGHVEPVQAARRHLNLERVVYLPTAHPPHKPGRRFAPPLARWAMVELALLGEEGLFASPLELHPDRRAFTIDTVLAFERELPGATLVLLVGADSFAELPQWVRWREIVEHAELAVLARPGFALDTLLAVAPPEIAAAHAAGRVHRVAQRELPFSSTEVRARLAAGEAPPAGALHPLVLDYARKYRLYR